MCAFVWKYNNEMESSGSVCFDFDTQGTNVFEITSLGPSTTPDEVVRLFFPFLVFFNPESH